MTKIFHKFFGCRDGRYVGHGYIEFRDDDEGIVKITKNKHNIYNCEICQRLYPEFKIRGNRHGLD